MTRILIIVGFLFVGQFLSAQTSDTIKDLPAEQVEVIKQFEAMLEDAQKVNIIPELPAQRVLEKFTYQVNVRPLLLEYPDPVIKPVAISSETNGRMFNGLLRVAAGNLNTLDAGIVYNIFTKQETEINIFADYLTMNNKKEKFQQIQDISANLSLSHSINSLVAFSGQLSYGQRDVGFYGSPLDIVASDTSIYSRRLSDYNIEFKVYNPEENEYDLNYSLGFDFKNFNLVDENLMENNLLVDGRVDKDLNENFNLSLSGIVDISNITDSSTTAYNNYFIKPGIAYNSEYFKIGAAVSFGFTADKTYYLPDVELAFSPFDYGFVPFVFWKASLQKNNVQQLFTYNPYLSIDLVPNLSNSVLMRYGLGFRGNVKNFLYEASVAYGSTDDLVLFKNVITDQNLRQFEILKDTSNILEVQVSGEYKINDKVEICTNFRFTDYSVVAWHIPSYTFDIGMSYYLLDKKLELSPSLFIRDGLRVRNDEGDAEDLPYLLDFSLSSSYQIQEQISVYAEVNNILSSEYQQWYDYSNFGINAKVGIKVKF